MIDSIIQDYLSVAITVMAFCATVYLWPRKKSIEQKCVNDLAKQSIEIEPGVRASIYADKDGNLETGYYEGVYTVYDVLPRGLKISNDGPCFGRRHKNSKRYSWISYSEVYHMAHRFGSALIIKGLNPQTTTRVGIYAYNCPEWNVVAQACSMFSMVMVPLYDSLGKDVCSYIINQTGLSLVVCGNWTKAKFLLDKAEFTPSLSIIVIISNEDYNNTTTISNADETRKSSLFVQVVRFAKSVDVDIISFEEMLQIGLRGPEELVLPKPESEYTIIYTSGTTGDPKGVVLTHKAFVNNINGLGACDPICKWINRKNVIHLSYLPAAHGFERMNQLLVLVNGGRIGFGCGDISRLMEDIAALRPTVFVAVPRVLNRIHDKVNQSLEKNFTRRIIYKLGMWRKLALLKRGIITKTTIWDSMVFHKIQHLLGDRIELLVTGAAPLSDHVMNFARAALGCLVQEGYGLTELCGPTTVTLPYETKCGVVGPPLPCCHIKLVDVPEFNFFVKNNIGEICIKSSAMMKEYFKEPGKTTKAIDSEGFLHTGDIGSWDSNGTLRIVDRIKQIFKLAQGEYVAPEVIENVYKACNFIAQVYVDGNSTMSNPVAIVVPEQAYLMIWAQKSFPTEVTFAELCKNQNVKKMLLNEMLAEGNHAKLKGYEQVKEIFITDTPFSVENGLMASTMKLKRGMIRHRYRKELSRMCNT